MASASVSLPSSSESVPLLYSHLPALLEDWTKDHTLDWAKLEFKLEPEILKVLNPLISTREFVPGMIELSAGSKNHDTLKEIDQLKKLPGYRTCIITACEKLIRSRSLHPSSTASVLHSLSAVNSNSASHSSASGKFLPPSIRILRSSFPYFYFLATFLSRSSLRSSLTSIEISCTHQFLVFSFFALVYFLSFTRSEIHH
jgi:hypothetical protein